eukprot:1814003-Lingulodinium_polyedra.AAC.1
MRRPGRACCSKLGERPSTRGRRLSKSSAAPTCRLKVCMGRGSCMSVLVDCPGRAAGAGAAPQTTPGGCGC